MRKRLFRRLFAAVLCIIMLAACGENTPKTTTAEETVDENVGKYYLVAMDADGDMFVPSEEGMEACYLRLKEGGNAVMQMDEDKYEGNWKVKKDVLTLKLTGPELDGEFEGTVSDGTIKVTMEEIDFTFIKGKSDAKAYIAAHPGSNTHNEPAFSLESQVVFENHGIKVIATGTDVDPYFGTVVKLSIENSTDKDLVVWSSGPTVINGAMVHDGFFTHVKAGKTEEDVLYIDEDFLARYSIEKIGCIDLGVSAYEEESFNSYFTTEAMERIKTNFYGEEDKPKVPDGAIKQYDQDGLAIWLINYDTDEYGDMEVWYYLENNSGKTVYFDADTAYLNNEEISSYFGQTLPTGIVSIDDLSYDSDELEAMNISSFDDAQEASVIFEIIDDGNFETIATTGVLQIKGIHTAPEPTEEESTEEPNENVLAGRTFYVIQWNDHPDRSQIENFTLTFPESEEEAALLKFADDVYDFAWSVSDGILTLSRGGDEADATINGGLIEIKSDELNALFVEGIDNARKVWDERFGGEPAESSAEATQEATGSGEWSGELAIEKQVVMDKNGVTVTALKIYEDDVYGWAVDFEVTNNTERDLIVASEYVTVEKAMLDDWLLCEIGAGETETETVWLDTDVLGYYSIETVGSFEIIISVYDDDKELLFTADPYLVKTNAYGYGDKPVLHERAIEMYSENGITVHFIGLHRSNNGNVYSRFYVINDTDKEIILDIDPASINDEEVGFYFYETVLPGCVLCWDGDYDMDDLTVDFNDITEAGFVLNLYDYVTYEEIATTEMVYIQFD